jgi:hypothetical protein
VPQSLLAANPTVPTPTLVWPAVGDSSIYEKPVITGLTVNNTKVEVYIDGKLNGMAKVLDGNKGTASFSYVPFLSLKPGKHTVAISAVNKDSKAKSLMSKETSFIIEDPYPTPTLFQPVVNDKTVSTKPYIVGLAVNDSLIKVFIDKKLNGQFKVINDESGVANFAYQPFLDLDPNKPHLVYVTAVSPEGKESSFSNVIGFNVEKPKVIMEEYEDPQVLGVSDTPVAEGNTAIEATDENNVTDPENPGTESDSTNENVDEESDQSADSEEDQSALVWWVILAIIVIIIAVNLRGRGNKDDVGGLKGLEKLGGLDNKISGQPGQQTLQNKENSEKKEEGNNMPPPPPSK